MLLAISISVFIFLFEITAKDTKKSFDFAKKRSVCYGNEFICNGIYSTRQRRFSNTLFHSHPQQMQFYSFLIAGRAKNRTFAAIS